MTQFLKRSSALGLVFGAFQFLVFGNIAIAEPLVEITVSEPNMILGKCTSLDPLPSARVRHPEYESLEDGTPIVTASLDALVPKYESKDLPCLYARRIAEFMKRNDFDGTLRIDLKKVTTTISLLFTQGFRWTASFELPNGTTFETTEYTDVGWQPTYYEAIFYAGVVPYTELVLKAQDYLNGLNPNTAAKLRDEFDAHLQTQHPSAIERTSPYLPERRGFTDFFEGTNWTLRTIVGTMRAINKFNWEPGVERFWPKKPEELRGCGFYLMGVPLY